MVQSLASALAEPPQARAAAAVFPASEAVRSVASVLLECGSVLLSCN